MQSPHNEPVEPAIVSEESTGHHHLPGLFTYVSQRLRVILPLLAVLVLGLALFDQAGHTTVITQSKSASPHQQTIIQQPNDSDNEVLGDTTTTPSDQTTTDDSSDIEDSAPDSNSSASSSASPTAPPSTPASSTTTCTTCPYDAGSCLDAADCVYTPPATSTPPTCGCSRYYRLTQGYQPTIMCPAFCMD